MVRVEVLSLRKLTRLWLSGVVVGWVLSWVFVLLFVVLVGVVEVPHIEDGVEPLELSNGTVWWGCGGVAAIAETRLVT